MNEMHSSLRQLIPFVDTVQATVGPYCEIVLHDFAHPEHSLVYVAGNVTNRQIGAPITDFVLAKLRNHVDGCENSMNYTTTTPEGKTLRCSTTFVRDADFKVIGCMCINIDISPVIAWKHFTEATLSVNTVPIEETFANDVAETLNNIIKQIVSQYPIPAVNLPKEEKLKVVQHLDDKGVFLVKGAIDQVATVLGVSRYSIYNYLDEVRSIKI